MKRIIISFVLLAMFSTFNYAQSGNHVLSIQAGGGMHQLKYSPAMGETKGGAGFSCDISYGYFFGQHVGLVTGVGVQSLKSEITLSEQTSMDDVDTDGDKYQFRTSYNQWKESQQTMMLDIPVGIGFRGDLTQKVSWYAATGAKVFIPVQSKYKVESGTIVTSGYYPQWNVELTEMPQHGFTTVDGNKEGDFKLKTSFGGFLNAGATFKLSAKLNFYAGLYGTYGFSSATDKTETAPYQKTGTYSSIVNSNLVDKTSVFSAGIQVGIMWSL